MNASLIRMGAVAAALFALAASGPAGGRERYFTIKGKIESIGKDDAIVLLFRERPAVRTYYIVDGATAYGTVRIASLVYDRTGQFRYRAAAVYRLSNRMYARQIRAGDDIALLARDAKEETDVSDSVPVKEREYRRNIVSPRDGRKMVLVPEGTFVFGSNEGDRDESPEHTVYLDDYYIDKYEVSNEDYKAFVVATNSQPPVAWKRDTYPDGAKDLPVMVTYREADAYARWAGKRLPGEEEWEKAARGGSDNAVRVYPWGDRFDAGRANCAEFWASESAGGHIKMRYGIASPGPLPVGSFDPDGVSPCGAVNMAGNVREWTSSWYMPYEGNTSKQGPEYRRYGKQYKVVRGGSWHDSRYRLRATGRDISGAPSIHAGNLAGFRCVKDPDSTDYEKKRDSRALSPGLKR
ncbi:MAG: SUMF1/EgtB/PvdO family nonheme iron enzyme [Spirochaetes bacterium]|nr:SUMF1/EgtB/PvdO family nonheme iron enzyme [Spirochaetota bacterium]